MVCFRWIRNWKPSSNHSRRKPHPLRPMRSNFVSHARSRSTRQARVKGIAHHAANPCASTDARRQNEGADNRRRKIDPSNVALLESRKLRESSACGRYYNHPLAYLSPPFQKGHTTLKHNRFTGKNEQERKADRRTIPPTAQRKH